MGFSFYLSFFKDCIFAIYMIIFLKLMKNMSPDVPMTLPLNVILSNVYFLTAPKFEKGTDFRNSL